MIQIQKRTRRYGRNIEGRYGQKEEDNSGNRNGDLIQDPKQIGRAFRETWKNVFKITEEEIFDDQHQNEIKDRMTPVMHRPFSMKLQIIIALLAIISEILMTG